MKDGINNHKSSLGERALGFFFGGGIHLDSVCIVQCNTAEDLRCYGPPSPYASLSNICANVVVLNMAIILSIFFTSQDLSAKKQSLWT